MTEAAISDVQRERILRQVVLPIHFSREPAGKPEFTLVAGQPGSGRPLTVRSLARASSTPVTTLSGEDLRAFHPGFPKLRRDESASAAQELAQAAAYWARECIRFARENQYPLILEGTFANASAAAALAGRFAGAGFSTRVVVSTARRAQSLLSVTSRYLRDVRAGDPPVYVTREAHDDALDASARLVDAAETTPFVDRLTLLSRGGRVDFDATGTLPADFAEASALFAAAQSSRMTRLDSTQWLSELHHCTDFALSRRDLPREVTESLIDLHETSLREVIPELHVPAVGKFTTAMEQRTAERLVALRRSLPSAPRVDVTGPVISPPGPDRGGMSR